MARHRGSPDLLDLQRYSLRLRIFLLFAALAGGALAALLLGLYVGYARTSGTPTQEALVIGGVIAGFALLGMIVWVWQLFDQNVAKPIERLAGELRARTHAQVSSGLDDTTARHLGDLAPAATALMRHLSAARNELAEAVARETTRQAIEKDRLVALLSDVPAGLLLCTPGHHLALYNGDALGLLDVAESDDTPGLDRRLGDYLDEAPIREAYDSLLRHDTPGAEREVLCTTRHTGRPLRGRIRLLGDISADHGGPRGYVLTLLPIEPSSAPCLPRTLVYDFDLLAKHRNADIADTPLDDLVYVVFDTETTGLLPGRGDEIVQLAAVRIVNGRRVETEMLDTLVNPGRSIPPIATAIHGITDAMVAEAPAVDAVVRRFHKFAQSAVLVAHNANFDLAFLRRHEARSGLRFDHPVLDTVLLSALVFGTAQNHSLDALTARLDVPLPAHARHTALGDTLATAEVLLKLLPAIKARGLNTYGELQAELRRHGGLLRNAGTG